MVTQIIPGIYQLKVPIPNNPLGDTNIYLVKDDTGYTMIDTGWDSDESLNSLHRQLAEINLDFTDLSRIIVTHAHFDHYGLAGKVKGFSGAKIYMHHLDEEIFHTRYIVTDEYRYRNEEWFRINGVPNTGIPIMRMPFGGPANTIPAHPDVFLNGGETIDCGTFSLKIIWTPGHSPGHICLYESNTKILFSGDHILPVITPNISLTPQSDNNPLGAFLKSLKEMKQIEVNLVLPAHENIFNNLSNRIDEIIYHHENRSLEILQSLNHRALTAYQVSSYITWMPEMGGVKFENLMPGDKRAAVSETLAHLKAMSEDNRLKILNQNGIVYYQSI
jgi:glyoxylase-like metal-dependent hydrolase (beta-lactamase superfamily II)